MNSRPYHHGDLRRALLDAALALIESQGAQAFTLREVARQVGVTHTAPYRHFKDKAELLAAVASEGFKLLCEATLSARDAAGSDQVARLRAIGIAYVRFGLEHSAHYRVMFGRALSLIPEPYPYQESADQAFAVLTGCVAELQASGRMAPGDGELRSVLGWSTVHGLALLLADGRLPLPPTREAQDAFIGALLDASHSGLMNALDRPA